MDVFIFSLGVACGALAIYVPWLRVAHRRYVLPCSNANCPHHGADLRRRIEERNERERQGPTRPPMK